MRERLYKCLADFAVADQADESNPYKHWFDGLSAQAAVKMTVAKLRMELGNTSSIKWFDGVGEYVIDWGPGYRMLAEYKVRKKAMAVKSSNKHKG